jgi:hypothetical protein
MQMELKVEPPKNTGCGTFTLGNTIKPVPTKQQPLPDVVMPPVDQDSPEARELLDRIKREKQQ